MDVSKTTTLKHFNSQPHKEADVVPETDFPRLADFNSQPHKEADVGDIQKTNDLLLFQLTASQGG